VACQPGKKPPLWLGIEVGDITTFSEQVGTQGKKKSGFMAEKRRGGRLSSLSKEGTVASARGGKIKVFFSV